MDFRQRPVLNLQLNVEREHKEDRFLKLLNPGSVHGLAWAIIVKKDHKYHLVVKFYEKILFYLDNKSVDNAKMKFVSFLLNNCKDIEDLSPIWSNGYNPSKDEIKTYI